MFALPGLITVLAVLQFLLLTFLVGRARSKYGVPAPHTDGPEGFRRTLRVQQNTHEQLVAFLPALWLFTWFLEAPIAAGMLGAIWLIGRSWYAYAYARGQNRFPGFILGIFTTTSLTLGALYGVVSALLA